MNSSAIVYTSNTGTTAQYAQMLSKQTGLPVYDLESATKQLERNTSIVYLGWLMAGTIKGYKKANKLFSICLVCGVGMSLAGSQIEEIRKTNNISNTIPLFTLQGGFYLEQLHGMNKLLMTIMKKTAGKGLQEKENRTKEEEALLEILLNGGSRVSEDQVKDVVNTLLY